MLKGGASDLMKKGNTRVLTEGSPWRHIVALAIPLLLGNIFQASYNLADTVIIGRFAGPEPLAGVGVASPIFNLINALLIGLSVGSSILISQLFGGKKEKELPKAVSTILWISLLLAVILFVIGQILVGPLLRVLQTPAEDLPYATLYLRVILFGLIGSVFYNQLTGMLRGLGNTKVPMYILIFCCCINAGLDMVFIYFMGLGVVGAALATIIAEGLSAVLAAIYIRMRVPLLHIGGQRYFDRSMFRSIFSLGLPMGFQQASISLGHVLLQGIVNPFGTALIAGYAAASKVDMFAVMPILALASAMSTFAAQNAGAGNMQRVKEGTRIGCGIIVIVCIALAVIVCPLRNFWMSLFVSTAEYPGLAPQIILMGASMLAITPLFYWILGLVHGLLNAMAGVGDTMFAMVAMIIMMFLRVVLAWCFIHIGGMNEIGIWISFPISWAITLLFVLVHYLRGKYIKSAQS